MAQLRHLLLVIQRYATWLSVLLLADCVSILQSELLYYISLANEGLRDFIVSNTVTIFSFDVYTCLLN